MKCCIDYIHTRILKKIFNLQKLRTETHFVDVKPSNSDNALYRVQLFVMCIYTWFNVINKIVEINIVQCS